MLEKTESTSKSVNKLQQALPQEMQKHSAPEVQSSCITSIRQTQVSRSRRILKQTATILSASSILCLTICSTCRSQETKDSPNKNPSPANAEAPANEISKPTSSANNESPEKSATEAIEKARTELARNRISEAKLILKQALATNPDNVSLLLELYRTSIKANDWSAAVQSLEKTMECDSSREKDIYCDYGQALFKLHKYDRAKTALNKAIVFGKDKDMIYKTLAQIALQEKDDPAAIVAYKEYLKVKPADGDIHWELANLLYKTGKTKESMPEYKLASDLTPHDSYRHERYAYLLLCDKSYDDSISAYKKAIAAKPGDGRLVQALKYAIQMQKSQFPPPQVKAK